ncbi:unnamed protein product, partial [Candidula unifasciata]
MESESRADSINEGEVVNATESEEVKSTVGEDVKNAVNEDEKIDTTDAGDSDSHGGDKGNSDADQLDNKHPSEYLEFSEDADALKEELDRIIVVLPDTEAQTRQEELFDPAEFPFSYKDNLPKEQLTLQFVENFRRQYVHLYQDRKPLFLNPVNECGVEKFVCTTVRPTLLPYKELNTWDGAAEFVAVYLNFDTLEPPYELPTRLISPATILKRQRGNCFEYSTLLCSMLIGAGYDAYVVSGYATRETCLADESREICPLLKKKDEKKEEVQKKQIKKYTVKPPKDLLSRFELKMEARKKAELKAEEEKQKAELERRQAELEKPPPDPLHGLRIHSWVLVLSGKREVPETFFIEPFTGLSHTSNYEAYLGIESLWNHSNYWVCMQDCSDGVAKLNYDLGDCTLWEYMFPNLDKPQLLIPEPVEDEYTDRFDDEDE